MARLLWVNLGLSARNRVGRTVGTAIWKDHTTVYCHRYRLSLARVD